jgi:MinD superfamily P-loop ATPase
VCINKADIYPDGSAEIEAFCREQDINVVGRIPFDVTITEAMVQGEPVTAYQPDAPASQALRNIWTKVFAILQDHRS